MPKNILKTFEWLTLFLNLLCACIKFIYFKVYFKVSKISPVIPTFKWCLRPCILLSALEHQWSTSEHPGTSHLVSVPSHAIKERLMNLGEEALQDQ